MSSDTYCYLYDTLLRDLEHLSAIKANNASDSLIVQNVGTCSLAGGRELQVKRAETVGEVRASALTSIFAAISSS